MSSESKSSRRSPAGRPTKSAAKTSPRISASLKRSPASRPAAAAVALLADLAAVMRRRRLRWYVFGVLLGQPRLDIERIRELLGELEVALGDEQLLRRFERIARKAR